VAWCRENVAALEVEHCGRAGHHAPEDRPEAIAAAINAWTGRHRLRTAEVATLS
jgi:haloalkane dehalogenase